MEFNSTGTTGQASLRVRFIISPEDCGVVAGSGKTWVAPPPREYAAPKPVAAAPVASAAIAPPATEAELEEARRLGRLVKESVSDELGYEPSSELHKAAQREFYLVKKEAEGKTPMAYPAWEKRYYTVLNNNKRGLRDEAK